ncbi:MAG: hypothetical protein ACFCGT_23560 [Sandaracinaceae bacterium]
MDARRALLLALALSALGACRRERPPARLAAGGAEPARGQSAPPGEPERPAPALPERQSCADLASRFPLYRLEAVEGGVQARRDGGRDPAAAVAPEGLVHPSGPTARLDVNGDGHPDLLGRLVAAADACAEAGCRQGLWVSCDAERHALLLLPTPRGTLTVGDVSFGYRGRPWRELREVSAGGATYYRRIESGYMPFREGARGHNDRCALLLQEEQLDAATEACEEGLRTSPDRRRRAFLLYTLGRIEEAQGDIVAAQDRYRSSLEARHSEAVLARLRRIGGHPPPIALVDEPEGDRAGATGDGEERAERPGSAEPAPTARPGAPAE